MEHQRKNLHRYWEDVRGVRARSSRCCHVYRDAWIHPVVVLSQLTDAAPLPDQKDTSSVSSHHMAKLSLA